MVGFNRRYAPAYLEAKRAFDGQSPQIVVAQKNRRGSEYRATFENAIHLVDLLRFFCGEPVAVQAHTIANNPYEEDGFVGVVTFESQAIGTLIAARTAGSWEERLDAYRGFVSAHVDAPNTCSLVQDGICSTYDAVPSAFGWATATAAFGFDAAVDELLECVRSRRAPESDGTSAARTQHLLERLLEAAGLPTEDRPGATWTSHATR
jgi:virulence factor